MDFLHSLWACSKRLCFVGPCPVVFFFPFRTRGSVLCRVTGRYRGRTAMRTSTCGTVMLVCATILGPITIVFLAVSFATDYWLEFKVDSGYTRLPTDNNRVSHTRHRGIFRECYPGNDTACEYLFSGIKILSWSHCVPVTGSWQLPHPLNGRLKIKITMRFRVVFFKFDWKISKDKTINDIPNHFYWSNTWSYLYGPIVLAAGLWIVCMTTCVTFCVISISNRLYIIIQLVVYEIYSFKKFRYLKKNWYKGLTIIITGIMFFNILNYCKVISDGIQNKQFPCYIFIQYSSKGKENYNNFLMVRRKWPHDLHSHLHCRIIFRGVLGGISKMSDFNTELFKLSPILGEVLGFSVANVNKLHEDLALPYSGGTFNHQYTILTIKQELTNVSLKNKLNFCKHFICKKKKMTSSPSLQILTPYIYNFKSFREKISFCGQ